MTTLITNSIGLLGRHAKDKVIGFEGIIEAVSFDLYGCIQVTLRPGLDEKGAPKEARWFDISRMDVSAAPPVMAAPPFALMGAEPAVHDHGAAEKPAR
jgi:hypothetical protein